MEGCDLCGSAQGRGRVVGAFGEGACVGRCRSSKKSSVTLVALSVGFLGGFPALACRLWPLALRLSADSVDSCVYSVFLPISKDSAVAWAHARPIAARL